MLKLIYQFNKLPNKICKNVRNLSTEVAIKTDPIVELLKDVEKVSNISRRVIKKKPQRPPFVKNLFLGNFDRDILTYPELPDKESVAALDSSVIPIEQFFQSTANYKERKLSRQFIENLSKLRLWGLQASSELGCRQLSVTESCKFNEYISSNTSRLGIILNESLGIQTLLKHGSEMQKAKYLQSLIDGKLLIAHCVSESNSYSATDIKTKATLSSDNRYWILNGEKTWIGNGDTADLFLVLAHTTSLGVDGLSVSGPSVLLVERGFGGVTSNSCNTIGLQQTDISNVQFENTPVPIENIIGKVTDGQNIITSILPEVRLTTGTACIAILKKAISKFVQHCIEVDGSSNNITSSEAIQLKVGEMITTLYAIESVTYLTSMLIDGYENQDCDLETAIVKVFSAEHCLNSVLNCMKIVETPAYMDGHWCSQLYCDALSHLFLNESTESVKLITALFGLQFAGVHLNDQIKKYRNPLFHPVDTYKRMWTQQRNVEDRPKLTLKLNEYLHPSVLFASELLEYSVLRLQFATETLLIRFGPEVITHHINLKRLADSVADIYVMAAVVGRASRSYCIGLEHSFMEVQIANAFCLSAKERVQKNVKDIYNGCFITPDEKLVNIAKQAFKSKGYFPKHPLARNF